MQTDGISRAEFAAFCDRIYRQVDSGFADLKDRLDVLNGRTLKGELEGENHRSRIVNLEHATFRSQHHLDEARGDEDLKRRRNDHAGDAEQWAGAFTKREYALMTLGFAVIMALIKLIEFLGGKVWTIISVGK